MKSFRLWIVALTLTFSAACSATDLTGPEQTDGVPTMGSGG
jgi:hypothetical protein